MNGAKLLETVRPRTLASWALVQGLPRMGLLSAARRGDLVAATAIDPDLRLDPFESYDRIREQGRFVESRLLNATAHHAVADEILRSDAFGVAGDAELGPPWLQRVLRHIVDHETPGPVDPPSLLAVNPPEHTRYRRLVSKVFTPRAITALRPRVRGVADDLLDAIDPSEPFDLIERYAKLLPLIMIGEFLGVSPEMHASVLATADAGAVLLDPGLPFREYRDARAAVRQAHRQIDEHIAELRRSPGPDLLSQLATLGGADRLTDRELRATALLLIGAGFETTVNLISNAVVALLDRPGQMQLLRDDPSRWENAVEEVLRFDSPVQVTLGVARRATEVAGVAVPTGRLVLVMLGAANRDPAVFADPDRFDITRDNAREHLALSAGVHFCLGANLARIEGAVALEALFDRMPHLAIAGTPRRRGTRVLRGFDELPLVARAAAAAA